MPETHVLVVEDEADILELVRFNLTRKGYQVTGAATGEEALRAARSQAPQLVLLDLMLPGIDGLEVCRQLRRDPRTAATPIIMLTAKGEEADVVTGLEQGADDYVTKPFSPKVLLARVQAVLRRPAQAAGADDVLHRGVLTLHPGRREVLLEGRAVTLTFTEFQVLHFLARRPGWVFTRGQIVDAIRGEDYAVTDRSVDVQIVGLRKKLAPHDDLVETVRGVGYRFRE